MKRNPSQLEEQSFDVLIIGGGSHGVCAARDAALRGMSVALIDKGDICGATSHNSLKTIHGGIRYLQHLNFKRVFESIKEQRIWLRTAPQLVKPLPFLMPTYGHGARGPFAMLAGFTLFRLFSLGHNKHLRPDRNVPAGSIISKSHCLKLAPDIKRAKLSGGALWYDAQIEHSDRAVMQIAEHANTCGATICNYVQATRFLFNENTVTGIQAADLITGKTFNVHAKTVLNATGPWVNELLKPHTQLNTDISLAKSMNLVTKLPAPEVAIAVQSTLSSDSKVGESKRLYFMVPWLGRAVVGTTHFSFDGSPDDLTIESAEILAFVNEINQAYPSLNLTADDVLYCYQGLLPDGENHDTASHRAKNNALQLHESKVVDHEKDHKVKGLVSIFSVKWTTARLVAEQAVNAIAKKLDNSTPCRTETEAIIDQQKLPYETHQLTTPELIAFCQSHIDHSLTVTLDDLLLRRTNDVVLGNLSFEQVQVMAQTMQQHFNWNAEQQNQQQQNLLKNWLPKELRQHLEKTPLWTH